jgi:hypothetical protein
MTNLPICGVALTALALAASPAAAQWAPWCLYEAGTKNGSVTCTFHTFEQCSATRSGIGGSCAPNPYLSHGAPYPVDRQTGKRSRGR